jgi:hypothetical protein
MSDLLAFSSTDTDDDDVVLPPFEFLLDGVVLTASKPKDALIAQLGPISSRRTSAVQKIQLALNFLDDCLHEPGKTAIRERLLDPADKLDAKHVMPILHAIGDHWREHTKALKKR